MRCSTLAPATSVRQWSASYDADHTALQQVRRTRLRARDEAALRRAVEDRAVVWIVGADTPEHHTCGQVVGLDLGGVLVALPGRGVVTLVPRGISDVHGLIPSVRVVGRTP